jgi:V8-like Glu-specific endopeptidase
MRTHINEEGFPMHTSVRKHLLTAALAACALLAGALPAQAQRAELSAERVPFQWDSGTEATVSRGGVLATQTIRVAGAQWLRLRFDDVALAPGSVLRITSLTDGARQHLNAAAAEQWQKTSAYFNGPAVLVELLGGQNTVGNRVAMREVLAGGRGAAPESQCGPADNRVASNAANRARLLDVGCTANLTADGCFITAGHCLATASTVDVVEFNVPLSKTNGTLVHPGPADQYVPTTNRQFSNAGIGNDWGVFTVFPNTETGLTPLQAQGAGLEFSTVLPKRRNPAEIIGYGVDSGTANQTQQVATGAIKSAATATNTLKYTIDTEGGNSGSAVLVGGLVVAIHTNGGCQTSGRGANSGTMIGNAGFRTAYAAVCGAPVTR